MWGQPQRRSRPTLATTRPQEVEELYALGVDPFVAPDRTRHGRELPAAPRGRIPGHLSARDRMRRKLRTKGGRQRYGRRKETVEPVFGQIKQGRGFRQFLLRGLEKVNREWSLISTGHNLLKLFRFGASQRGKATRNGPTGHINTGNINTGNINTGHTKAGHTKAGNIKAGHINTGHTKAGNIKEESWAVGELIIVRLSARLHPSTAGTAAA